MITSCSNQSVREVIKLNQRAKARRDAGLFVTEGVKLFAEAPIDRIEKVFIAQSAEKGLRGEYRDKLSRTGCETVADDVFCRMSDTKTPQGVLCLVRQFPYREEEIVSDSVKKNPMFLILEDIQDPGNLGTLFRTGEGAGVDGILMSGQTVDIYNAKAIRSTMGSIFRVPFAYVEDIGKTVALLQKKGITVFAAQLDGAKFYEEYEYTQGVAFLIGNEGNGLKKETASLADAHLKIPMQGKVESLNAAVAASILMYEAYRQRRSR